MRLFRAATIVLATILASFGLVVGCGVDPRPTTTRVPTMPLPTVGPGTPTRTAASQAPLTSQAPDQTAVETALPDAPSPTAAPLLPTVTPTTPPTSVWLDRGLPTQLAQALTEAIVAQPERYALTQDRSIAQIQVGGQNVGEEPVATWVYALVAPFPTVTDGVSGQDLKSSWAGNPSGPFGGHPLLMTETTLAALVGKWGEPAPGSVVTVPEGELLDRAWAEQPAWAIIPFDALEPRWKVLRVDGLSPLDRGLDLNTYPLIQWIYGSARGGEWESFLAGVDLTATNRDETYMTVVVMTGVTALTRATAWRMEQKGMTYPAQDIGDWVRDADISHVSNEVAFDPECGPPNPVQEGLLFCSDPRYIELLEHIGVDVVEMTGNHIADAGVEHIAPTLDMYTERGWQYFGGGYNLEDARQPAVFHHNGNVVAFLGCNPAGPPSVWATPERAGAAPCDYDLLYAQLGELRAQGVSPIVTLQYWEMDRYDPTPQQVADFQALIEAGAVIVSGSHAHHAQGFGFHAGGFIHYGLGNLFFDQMELLGNRQEFIDRHVFYGGRHISTELFTALLEDWSRPRPMTEQERAELLQTVFAISQWE